MFHAKFHDHRTISSVEKRFLKVFIIYECGSHLSHVTWTFNIYFFPPSQGGCTYNLALIGQVVLESKIFEIGNGCHIHVYSPGAGTDNPLGHFFH